MLQKYADSHQYIFQPKLSLTPVKFRNFGNTELHKIKSEENLVSGKIMNYDFELSDITIEEVQRLTKYDYKMTVLILDKGNFDLPDFSIEAEGLLDFFSNKKDIDFIEFPVFSKKYLVAGKDEIAIRNFFNDQMINFFESHPDVYMEAIDGKLFIYKESELLSAEESNSLLKFSQDFLEKISKPEIAAM